MNKVVKLSLIFGLAGAFCYMLFFVVIYFTVPNPLSYKMAPLGIQLIFVLFCIWYLKKKGDGYLHFYQGFTAGILSNLIIALVSGILLFCFIQFIDLKPFEDWIAESKKFLLDDRENKKEIMSDEAFQLMLTSLDQSKPASVILDRLMTSFWLVFPIGLFSMAFRKVKPL